MSAPGDLTSEKGSQRLLFSYVTFVTNLAANRDYLCFIKHTALIQAR